MLVGFSICSIENVDPMGVHTGDSITIAPAQARPPLPGSSRVFRDFREIRVKGLAVVLDQLRATPSPSRPPRQRPAMILP